jgi:secreted trypsin-like serine protease
VQDFPDVELLSLLVVPAVFTYVDDFEHWIGRQVRGLRRRPVVDTKKTPEPTSVK